MVNKIVGDKKTKEKEKIYKLYIFYIFFLNLYAYIKYILL